MQLKRRGTLTTTNNQTKLSENNIHDILRDKRTFKHMPESMFVKLIKVMKPYRINKGDVIIKQGESNQPVYIILKGKVTVRINGKVLYVLARTGDVFGEISFINNIPCTATIVAEEDSVVLIMSSQTLKDIGDTDFYIWLCRVIAEKLARTSKLIEPITGDQI